jgi:hypothetical protein
MKEVIIDWSEDGKSLKGVVVIKKLNFREKNQIEEESTDVRIVAGQPIVKVSSSKLKEMTLLKSIFSFDIISTDDKGISTKYVLDRDGIGNLPDEVGSQILDEISEMNTQSVKKNN